MINDDINKDIHSPNKGKVVAGAILVVVGLLFLARQFSDFFFPSWLFSWPMWVIAWGLYMGAKHNWRNSSWVIMMIIGGAFLLDEIPAAGRHDIGWCVMIIGLGVYMIMRRNHKWDKSDWKNYNTKWDWRNSKYGQPAEPVVDYTTGTGVPPTDPNPSASTGGYRASADDYLDALSVFGGVKKTIVSKDFKGGEIVNVFGGAEIDFTQANINGHVVIDITQIFGGTKILVPSHWRVVPDMAAVFASVDDKRIRTNAPADTDKVLVLKGISIFAGVDIRSY